MLKVQPPFILSQSLFLGDGYQHLQTLEPGAMGAPDGRVLGHIALHARSHGKVLVVDVTDDGSETRERVIGYGPRCHLLL